MDLLADSAFGRVLQSARSVYYVGLSDSWVSSNYCDKLVTALQNGVKFAVYLYLPEDTSDASIQDYVGVFRRYTPQGDDYLGQLRGMWMEPALPRFTGRPCASGAGRDTAYMSNYSKSFYSAYPEGWLVAVNVTPESLKDADRLFFFPYLVQAVKMSRPGLCVPKESELFAELLAWLRTVYTSSKPASEAPTKWWKDKLMSATDQAPARPGSGSPRTQFLE